MGQWDSDSDEVKWLYLTEHDQQYSEKEFNISDIRDDSFCDNGRPKHA